jgi:hypothetical protein
MNEAAVIAVSAAKNNAKIQFRRRRISVVAHPWRSSISSPRRNIANNKKMKMNDGYFREF